MIASLTGKDGIRVARFRGENWIVAGESARIAALESQLASLASAIAAIRVPPDSSAALDELRKIVEANQRTAEENAVTHGVATVDFGAFPGVTEASATVTVTGLAASAAVLAWPLVAATADHTVTDVYLEELACEVESVAAGSFVLLVRPRAGLAFGTFQINYLYL